jgi:hypothetical protein
MTGPRTRQELYDRIRESSKDEVILEEMIRLGFWPRAGSIPQDPGDEIRRKADLERQIAALRTEQARLGNVEALRRELHKRRLEASKQKQKETKERHERERLARAAAWKDHKTREILYLGKGVSGGLTRGAETNLAKLRARGLPELENARAVAQAIGVTVNELRFLAYQRRTTHKTHYVRFYIPKKTGGMRLISAPMPRLKRAQKWLADAVLAKVALDAAAHGFADDRSIVTNARPHLRADVVVNLDLKDFFPTITYERIKGMFRGLGYNEAVATILALLASEPETQEVELDGKTYFVATSKRRLPQGSPASPLITNVLCRRLDKRLRGAAKKIGFQYTRYADDLTFSARAKHAKTGKLLRAVRWLAAQEGFAEHEKKTRILRRGRRQEVTGVVVNEKLGVDRPTLRRFRALLHQLDKDGPVGKTWGNGNDVFASAIGFAAYVAMVDADKGRPLLEKARAAARKHGWKTPRRPVRPATPIARPAAPIAVTPAPQAPAVSHSPAPETPPEPPEGGTPKKKWWKIF